jgi:parvulin-like peptidyl-prolyl isomerase
LPELLQERRTHAEQIAQRAAAGADFAELARRHSEDAATRAEGGSLGWVKAGQLAPALDRAVLALDSGQIAAPVRLDDKFVIPKVVEREPSELPSYEEARSELAERVYMEKMNKARRQWLDSLRHRTHIDVRL